MAKARRSASIIGWREWVALPELEVSAIKAKIDTGALTSSLHAFQIEIFKNRGQDYVRFQVHPRQKSARLAVEVEAPLLEMRSVRSSNGHLSERPVIETEVQLFDQRWMIELTLANRDQMGFRMLLGREALRGRFLVDVGSSFLDRTRIPSSKRK
ncbi:ATP-dependent zinc protease family protein [Planctomicrobium sp. SH668]|uniref:ATP-dependent zinc protease family protein n=1 Tax=Planctomicrobium sp. SH668 TaxID=3448126 RepID=UPI003F5B06A1